MAKITPGNLSPDALPRVRGVVLSRPFRDGWYMQAWPKPRGDNQHPNSKYTAQQWAFAARMAANAIDFDLICAKAMTAGTDWVPRDLLMRGIFGAAYTIIMPDGTEMVPAAHSPPAPRRPVITQWQSSAFDTAYATTTNTTLNAFKGSIIRPRQNMSVLGAQAIFTAVIGATYKMLIARLNVGLVIQEIVLSTAVQATDTERRWREFDLTTSLSNGETYALMVGRTNGANNYALPINFDLAPKWPFPVTPVGSALLAQAAPAVGHTITGGTNTSPPFSLATQF